MNCQHATSPDAEDSRTQLQAGSPPRVPIVTQYLVLGSAAGIAALLAAAGIIATLQEDALRSWWESSLVENGTVDLLNLLVGLTAVSTLVALVATSLWLLDIRKVAEWASPGTYHQRSSCWAVLGWIVPVVNLWFPYQVVADASRGVGSPVRRLWPWWIAWLALNYHSFVGTHSGVLVTEADLTGWIRAHQIGAVIAVVAVVLWWRVVRSATAAATAAVDGVRVPS